MLMNYPGKHFTDTLAAYKYLSVLLILEDSFHITRFSLFPSSRSHVKNFYVCLIAASVRCARWLNLLAWIEVQASRLEFKLCLVSILPAHLASRRLELAWKPWGIWSWSTAHVAKTVQLCYGRSTHLSNCKASLPLRTGYQETLCWQT